MKKLLSFALTLTLAFSVTAFAAGDDAGTDTTAGDTVIRPDPDNDYKPNPESGSTSVSYTVNPAYTVTIPEKVTVGGDAVTVSAEGVKVGYGKQVVVTLTGINEDSDDNSTNNDTFTVALTGNTDEKLEYTVSAAGNVYSSDDSNTNSNAAKESIKKGGVVLTVESGLENDKKESGASTGSTELTFKLATGAVVKYAGEYTGTVTFTVSVEEVPETTAP